MNVDNLTIAQARSIASMFSTPMAAPRLIHPMNGKGVVAVLPNGFIHYGTLHDDPCGRSLSDASNLRSWKQREGGLPQFAKDGPVDGDQIDPIGTFYIETVLFFYPMGDWS